MMRTGIDESFDASMVSIPPMMQALHVQINAYMSTNGAVRLHVVECAAAHKYITAQAYPVQRAYAHVIQLISGA